MCVFVCVAYLYVTVETKTKVKHCSLEEQKLKLFFASAHS